ncbi:MAG TPA: CPBP family glutamic-type intramembrane protease [Thermoanaerobaculia bacterium]|nr:CPBP family glutamic-type intramembrane protease [Thermoanaerobaculia bacterium]
MRGAAATEGDGSGREGAAVQLGRSRRMVLVVELLVLFVAVPLALVPLRQRFAPLMMPVLLAIAIGCLVVLLRDPQFDRTRLWHVEGLRKGLGRTLVLWVLGGAALVVATWLWRPDLFLRLPRESPALWLAILALYPLLSVYPQEIIFRTFLFERYRAVIPDPRHRVAASALSFALAHLFFANWIAPVLSLLGGLLFATSYARRRSTLLVCVEHGLWGDLLFTVGLGWYFYGGSIAST